MSTQLTFDTHPEGYEPRIDIDAITDPERHPLWPRENTTDRAYLYAQFVHRISTENMGRMIRNERRRKGLCPHCSCRRYPGHDCSTWGTA